MKSHSQIRFSIIVTVFLFFTRMTNGYVLVRCDNFREDVENGVEDFLRSVRSAGSSLSVDFDGHLLDWYGLLNPLFPELTTSPLQIGQFKHTLQLFREYDSAEYANVAAAQTGRQTPSTYLMGAPKDLQALDSSTTFVCDPSIFQYEDGLWLDTTTGNLYRGMRGPEICPPGAKIAIAEVLQRPQHFTVVLCPELLTQTPGKHKMFATLSEVELTNTRENFDVNGETVPEDQFAWTTMSIDNLRQEVLSVYLGLAIMYIQGVKFEKKIVDDRGNTEGYLNIGGSPHNNSDTARHLSTDQALKNIDSLSLYITGAGFYLDMLERANYDSILNHIPAWDDEGRLYLASAQGLYWGRGT